MIDDDDDDDDYYYYYYYYRSQVVVAVVVVVVVVVVQIWFSLHTHRPILLFSMAGGVIDARYELRVPTHNELKKWGAGITGVSGDIWQLLD